MRKTLLLLSYLCATSALLAAWQLPVTNYYPRDYEAGTQNWQIKQQRNGWIYAANNYGLLEFDGRRWGLYGIWNSTVIRSVEISPEGPIYVGGANEFGRFTSNGFGGLDYTPLSLDIPEKYRNFGEVWNMHLLHNDLYIQTRNYFFKQTADGQLTVIEPKSRIFCSAKIRDGLFVATADGIYLLTGDRLNALRGSEQLRGYEIRSMQPYGDNGVLIGTDFDGLFLFDGDAIRRFETDADPFLRTNQLYTFAVGEKYIAYGTVLNGLVITDLNGNNCRYVNTQNGLQNNTVLSLFFDAENNLWIGLDQGLDRLIIDSPMASLYGQLHFYGSGYTSFIRGNTIYLGTNQGLYYTAYPFDNTKHITDLSMVEQSLGQVWSLNEVYGLLFCCHNRGLFAVDGHRLLPICTQEGFWQVRALPGEGNYLLAGSYNGLYLLQVQQGQCHLLHSIRGFEVTSRNFEVDEGGHIWAVSNRGVERLTLDAAKETCLAELIQPYAEQNDYFDIEKVDGRIVVSNSRFCRMTNAVGQLEEAPEFFALLDGVRHYSSICKDKDNNLWYLVGDALKVRPYDMRTRQYAALPVQIINRPRFFVGGFAHINPQGAGEAIVGSVGGFGLASLANASLAASPHVQQVLVRRMCITTPKDSVVYGQSYPVVPHAVRIPYRNNSVRFEFGGAFCLDGTAEYNVRLLPIDEEKDVWTRGNIKEYTELHEGSYTFEVRMRTDGGKESVMRFSFQVLPPWYRSWWAYLLWCGLVLLLAYGIYRYIRRRVEAGRHKLARQKDAEMKERERQFAEEAHMREREILRLQNERTEFELKNKSQELSNVLLNHLNKNELITDVKRDLKKIAADLQDKDIDNAMRRIILMQGKMTRNIEQEIDWKKFEENFDIVNDKFLKKLMQRYPWLNKNERKLCVYIRTGLITKEIAPLMNLSVRGVEMLRYRMRKKMELDRSEDLEEFFQMLGQNEDTLSAEDKEQALKGN